MSDNYYNSWISARSWMYNRTDPYTGHFTEEFIAGVAGFLEFAGNQAFALECRGKFYCPCTLCKCEVLRTGRKISNHIYGNGFMSGYHVWFRHGEELNVDLGCSNNDNIGGSSSQNYQEEAPIIPPREDVFEGERYVDMVNDTMNPGNIYQHEEGSHHHDENALGPNSLPML